MEKTTKRLEIMAIFQELFKQADLYDENKQPIHDKIIYLCQGKLYPDWRRKPELQMAKELAKRAIALTGPRLETVNDVFKKVGDLGTAFGILKQQIDENSTQSTLYKTERVLTVSEVYNTLVQIANYSGVVSQKKKISMLSGMLSRCEAQEAKYIGRFIDSKMRLGTADLTMIEAIARMLAKNENEQSINREIIERAYNIYPDLGTVLKTVMLEGIDAMKRFQPKLGVPIRSMLAQRLDSPEEFLPKHGGEFAAEYKLDGERVQIHTRDKKVMLFSRRQEVISKQYPDVVNSVMNYITAKSAILDGEIVAIEPGTGKLMPFQLLMRRRRKYGVDEKMEEIPTRVYLFDVLLLDGKSMLDTPYLERRACLERSVSTSQDKILPVPQKIIKSYPEFVDFFNQAIKNGTEGLLTKSTKPESVYQPGARGWLWIKLKSLQRGKLPDAIDVVIIGVNWGEGRRAGQWGTLLVAVNNEDTGSLEMLTRVSSGMDDEKAEFLFKNLKTIPTCPRNVKSTETPDKWVEPDTILEIVGDEITESPNTIIGYSIRFPRIVRIRDDKGVDDITTAAEVLSMRTGSRNETDI